MRLLPPEPSTRSGPSGPINTEGDIIVVMRRPAVSRWNPCGFDVLFAEEVVDVDPEALEHGAATLTVAHRQ